LSAAVRRRRRSLLNCGNRQRRRLPDPHQPPWQCASRPSLDGSPRPRGCWGPRRRALTFPPQTRYEALEPGSSPSAPSSRDWRSSGGSCGSFGARRGSAKARSHRGPARRASSSTDQSIVHRICDARCTGPLRRHIYTGLSTPGRSPCHWMDLMAFRSIQDRWYVIDPVTGRRMPSARHGRGLRYRPRYRGRRMQ
jgi:hypothetical protein